MMTRTRAARRLALAMVSAVALMIVAGCDGDDDVTGPIVTGAVMTFRDPAVDFSQLKTFSIVDTVVHLAPLTGTPLPVSREFDDLAINEVRANLLARGFIENLNPTTAQSDIVVLVGATSSEQWAAYVGYPWYAYYGFYPGWTTYGTFDASWTVFYPWYPVDDLTSFDQSTLVIDFVNPRVQVNPLNGAGRTISSIWAGVATAVLNGSVTGTTISNAIDEMFAQSPYLVASP
jgi:hypothetical protein